MLAAKQAESVAGLGSGTQDSDSEEEEAEGESEPQNNRGKKRHRGASDDTNAETQRILRGKSCCEPVCPTHVLQSFAALVSMA